jgi:TPR repeat protein
VSSLLGVQMESTGSSYPCAATKLPESRRLPIRRLAWVFVALFASLAVHDSQAQTPDQRGGKLPPNPAPSGSTTGSYYALVIGINEYQPPMPKLKTAVGDATAIGKLLNERYGFQVTYLLDRQATRSNILSALGKYRNTLNEDDNLLIYYAGHGYSDHDADKAYWLPVDAESGASVNRIIADDLTSDVKVLPSRHVLVVSDSCYSGSLTRDADGPERADDQPAYIARMLRSKSRTLLASGGDEPVADGGADGHSIFAYALLHALEQAQQPVFTATDLFYSSVRRQVAGKSAQLPQYNYIRNSNDDAGDFVFTLKLSLKPPGADQKLLAATEYNRGRTLYYQNRIAEALPLLVAVCEAGDPRGCRYAGGSYLWGGKGIQPNLPQAEKYLRLACDGGSMRGCTNLGSMYASGKVGDKDQIQAVILYRQGCEGGDASGCAQLGLAYKNGEGLSPDSEKAQEYFRKEASIHRKECDGGELVECHNLAIDFENGEGVAKDPIQASSLYRIACDGGFASGCNSLGVLYRKGDGVAQNDIQAAGYFRKACDGLEALGCINLGWMYANGKGMKKDYRIAANLYREACEDGDTGGCVYLGQTYDIGDGVKVDHVQANAIFERACNGGNAAGCTNLGVAYVNGSGVVKDVAAAIPLYRKACDAGEPTACLNLGINYANGQGVDQSDVRAAAFYLKACDGGQAVGCKNLGAAYANGKGTIKDAVQAAAFYRKACDNGDDTGCAEVNPKPTGEEAQQTIDERQKDLKKTIDEFAKSRREDCEAGSTSSCFLLGALYENGVGVDKDAKLAAKYYGQTCDNGLEGACEKLKLLKP